MFLSGSAAPEQGTAGHPISRYDSADRRRSDGRDRAAANWSAIPWGFVGMVALVVGFETFVGRNWLDFSDPVSLSWRYSASSVPQGSSEREILCLGDSLIKHGLIPGVIEQETGRKTVNLSAARAPTLLTYFLLRRALDAGADPQALIIDAKPAVLLAGPEFNARYWQEVLAPRECVDLARLASSGSFVLSTIVGRLLPSLRGRLEVRSNVLAALKGENDPIAAMNRVLWRNWTVNDGANVASPATRSDPESEVEIEHRLHPRVFYVDRANAAGLEWLLQLADERQIPVFWLLPPISSDLQARRDQSGAEAGFERYVRSFTMRYPRTLAVLDARRGAYTSQMFIDRTHLNGVGAVALSRAVATAIRPVLARRDAHSSPLWLTLSLPSDRPAKATVPAEDLDQSRRVLNLSRSEYATSR